MIPHTQAEDDVLARTDYGVHARLRVSSAVPYSGIDLSVADLLGYDPFRSATVSFDLDQPVGQATIHVHLGEGTTNLSPYVDEGPGWNTVLPSGASYRRPLFDLGLYLMLEVKCSADEPGTIGFAALPWSPLFAGRIDTVDPAEGDEDVLVINLRDIYSDLLDRWLEPSDDNTNGTALPDYPIESLLGQLKIMGMGNLQSQYTQRVIGTPNLLVPAYFQEVGSTLLAMRRAALLNGWDLRLKWYDNGGVISPALTYYEPDRLGTGTPLTWRPGNYFSLHRLTKTRDEIRNAWRVVPADPPRTPVNVQDEDSISLYGRSWAGLSEDVFSGIRTHDQAQALAQAVLSDTKSPKVMAEIEGAFNPFVEINDRLTLEANGVQIGTSLPLAITGYVQTLNRNGDATTTVRTRDAPAAANREWRQGGPKMRYTSAYPPSGPAAEGAEYFEL